MVGNGKRREREGQGWLWEKVRETRPDDIPPAKGVLPYRWRRWKPRLSLYPRFPSRRDAFSYLRANSRTRSPPARFPAVNPAKCRERRLALLPIPPPPIPPSPSESLNSIPPCCIEMETLSVTAPNCRRYFVTDGKRKCCWRYGPMGKHKNNSRAILI